MMSPSSEIEAEAAGDERVLALLARRGIIVQVGPGPVEAVLPRQLDRAMGAS
jgi:hypothetical protein